MISTPRDIHPVRASEMHRDVAGFLKCLRGPDKREVGSSTLPRPTRIATRVSPPSQALGGLFWLDPRPGSFAHGLEKKSDLIRSLPRTLLPFRRLAFRALRPCRRFGAARRVGAGLGFGFDAVLACFRAGFVVRPLDVPNVTCTALPVIENCGALPPSALPVNWLAVYDARFGAVRTVYLWPGVTPLL